jgi:hypothetical protein
MSPAGHVRVSLLTNVDARKIMATGYHMAMGVIVAV